MSPEESPEEVQRPTAANAETLQPLLAVLTEMSRHLARIAASQELLVLFSAPRSPNYTYRLSDYKNFDWSSIDAEVVARDRFGPTEVKRYGLVYRRRSPSNNFGEAIFYSRSVGSTDGQKRYERLITFKPPEKARAIPEETREAMGADQAAGAAPKPPPPAPAAAPAVLAVGEKRPEVIEAVLRGVRRPSAVAEAATLANGSTLYWLAVRRFRLDEDLARSILRDITGRGSFPEQWQQALRALDQHLPD